MNVGAVVAQFISVPSGLTGNTALHSRLSAARCLLGTLMLQWLANLDDPAGLYIDVDRIELGLTAFLGTAR